MSISAQNEKKKTKKERNQQRKTLNVLYNVKYTLQTTIQSPRHFLILLRPLLFHRQPQIL